jgi:endonuclease/exonuclease/phosphatase family metal-dependent hydrolase
MRRSWYGCATLSALALALAVLTGCPTPTSRPAPEPEPEPSPEAGWGARGDYLFCFWNVENLFDDQDDQRKTRADAPFDRWFAQDKPALEAKLEHLSGVLAALNDGRGPDILAVAEVESERAAQLLADAMRWRLRKRELVYRNVIYRAPAGGRHIATAVLSRLPVVHDRVKLWDKRHRILEVPLRVNDHDLIVVASHWTSRVSDHKGEGRAKYGDLIYGRYKAMYLSARKAGRDLDLLVCGDFNDNPDDPSVTEHLRAVGDPDRVRTSPEPLLFNLFAKAYKDGEASHYYGRKAYLFDQICVSPGLLDDRGWSCDVASARVVKEIADKRGRPNRFGGPNDKRPFSARGASDHFPVTVRLSVRP